MMENTGIVPTMPIGGNGAFENDSWIFLFAILALMWGGNGLFGGRCNAATERCATVEDLNNSANFTRLEGQVMNNGNRIEQKADGIATVYLANNGVIIPQAFGSETITTADTELRTITFSTIVRVLPGSTVNLSLVNTGVATTATKVDLIIEKLN